MSDSAGALVISIDFELLWGVRDIFPIDSPYARTNVLGVRKAIPALLRLFEKYDIGATWGVVGALCAKNVAERTRFMPSILPSYVNRQLSPYSQVTGQDESADPLHFGESLVHAIQSSPKQELASHTYAHFYCLEAGQTVEAFDSDCNAFAEIVARYGIFPRSIILPRNQWNPAYASVLLRHGIDCYRGNQHHWAYEAADGSGNTLKKRMMRLVDTYLPLCGDHSFAWEQIAQPDGTKNIPASFFLRPWSAGLAFLEEVRFQRINRAMTRAARQGRLLHLWFHPHNYGINIEKNLQFLERILKRRQELGKQYGFAVMTMAEVAGRVDTMCAKSKA